MGRNTHRKARNFLYCLYANCACLHTAVYCLDGMNDLNFVFCCVAEDIEHVLCLFPKIFNHAEYSCRTLRFTLDVRAPEFVLALLSGSSGKMRQPFPIPLEFFERAGLFFFFWDTMFLNIPDLIVCLWIVTFGCRLYLSHSSSDSITPFSGSI